MESTDNPPATAPPSTPQRRRWLFRAAAVLIPTVVMLAGAEAVLQFRLGDILRTDEFWSDMVRIHVPADDPVLAYRLNPGAEIFRDGVTMTINSWGYRDDEFPAEFAPGAPRIVVLGDSVAWGWGVENEEAFPQVLERMMKEKAEPGAVAPVVYNLSVGGYSTAQEIRQLETEGLEFEPDLVILNYVMNDPDTVDAGLKAHFTRPRSELLKLAADALFNLDEKLTADEEAERLGDDYHQYIHRRRRHETEAHFASLGRIRRETGVPILVVIHPVYSFKAGGSYAWANLHENITRLARENGLATFDLYDALRAYDSSDISHDQWHPNVKGHALIAGLLCGRLKEEFGF